MQLQKEREWPPSLRSEALLNCCASRCTAPLLHATLPHWLRLHLRLLHSLRLHLLLLPPKPPRWRSISSARTQGPGAFEPTSTQQQRGDELADPWAGPLLQQQQPSSQASSAPSPRCDIKAFHGAASALRPVLLGPWNPAARSLMTTNCLGALNLSQGQLGKELRCRNAKFLSGMKLWLSSAECSQASSAHAGICKHSPPPCLARAIPGDAAACCIAAARYAGAL